MKLPCKFQLGARVYHRCDPDAGRGMVSDITFQGNGGIRYTVMWNAKDYAEHYEMELTTAREWNPDSSDEGDDSDPPKQSAAETK